MRSDDLARIAKNIQEVLGDGGLEFAPGASSEAASRLRAMADLPGREQSDTLTQVPLEVMDYLDPDLSYGARGTPAGREGSQPKATADHAQDTAKKGRSLKARALGQTSGESSDPDQDLRSQSFLAQVTRDLNALVETGSLSPGQRKYILAGMSEGKDDLRVPGYRGTAAQVSPSAAVRQWSPALYVYPTAPFAGAIPAKRRYRMLMELRNLTRETQSQVRFSNHTGLVRTLRGNLLGPVADRDLEAAARRFVRQNSLALVGTRTASIAEGPIVGRTVRLRQVVDGVPVHGATITANFDQDGRLTYLNNSFYPISPQRTRFDRRFRLPWENAAKDAIRHVRDDLLPSTEKALARGHPSDRPIPEFDAYPGDRIGKEPDRRGQVIFPVLRTDSFDAKRAPERSAESKERVPDYVAAWLVNVVEKVSGRSWSVAVDAEMAGARGGGGPSILAARENVSGASLHVPRDPLEALGFVPVTDVSLPDDVADLSDFEILSEEETGSGTTILSHPSLATAPAPDALRYANAYLHLTQAKAWFRSIVQEAWKDTPHNRPSLWGDSQRLRVQFEYEPTDAKFGWEPSPMLRICRVAPATPDLADAEDPGKHPPFGDPATDPEVLYHEFTHAVFHSIQPDLHILYDESPFFHGAIDEGLAFYYACSISDQIIQKIVSGVSPQVADQIRQMVHPYRWGKMSRRHHRWTDTGLRDLERTTHQEADYDFMRVYGVFPTYFPSVSDPDGNLYACGMLWARALWDVRRVLGPRLADAVIMRAAYLAGGIQSDLETLAEAIIYIDSEMAKARNTASHESALRLIFASRGILADSPINDLKTVILGNHEFVLAATEDTNRSGTGSGCLISMDGGKSWTPLGKGATPQNGAGPGADTGELLEVVALAILKINEQQAIVWAATEAWIGQDGQPAHTLVYSYDLRIDNAGQPILDAFWSALPPLGIEAGILSLAVMHGPTGKPWLFAGTEDGVFKFDYDVNMWPNLGEDGRPAANWGSDDAPVFDLSVGALDGVTKLLASTQGGPRVLDVAWPTSPANPVPNNKKAASRDVQFPVRPPSGGSSPVLTMRLVTDTAGKNHLLAATADRGLLYWDPDEAAFNKWKSVPDIGLQDDTSNRVRPIFTLWPNPAGSGRELVAGTSDGVYRKVNNGDWTADAVVSSRSESLSNTSVVALCEVDRTLPNPTLLIGTGQRGIWRLDNGKWSRVAESVSRIGRLTDARSDIDVGFSGKLAAGDVGTHVLHVTRTGYKDLSFPLTTQQGHVVGVDIFYVAPEIDLSHERLAGLQLRAPAELQGSVAPGFYLMAVRSGDNGVEYSLRIDLTE